MYKWRKLSVEEREKLLDERMSKRHPWHSPPHRDDGYCSYHISAACYNHQHYIGYSKERIDRFSQQLYDVFEHAKAPCHAWCVLPNHYHALISTATISDVLKMVAQLHGRTSYEWNREENSRGRKNWFNVTERTMRTDRHFWATINYIHNNPVKHGYVKKWTHWPFSSAHTYLDEVGYEQAVEVWKRYPVLDYGKGWDDK